MNGKAYKVTNCRIGPGRRPVQATGESSLKKEASDPAVESFVAGKNIQGRKPGPPGKGEKHRGGESSEKNFLLQSMALLTLGDKESVIQTMSVESIWEGEIFS